MVTWKKSSFSYGELNVVRRVECRTGDSAFLSSYQTLLNECKALATESNFILFLSFYRIGFRLVDVRRICIDVFAVDQTTSVSAP